MHADQKEKIKLPLCTEDMIIYQHPPKKNQEIPQKFHTTTSEFKNFAQNKVINYISINLQ